MHRTGLRGCRGTRPIVAWPARRGWSGTHKCRRRRCPSLPTWGTELRPKRLPRLLRSALLQSPLLVIICPIRCCQSACLLFAASACYQRMPMLHKNPSAIGWKVQWECHQCAHAKITHTVDSARQRLAAEASVLSNFTDRLLREVLTRRAADFSACRLAWEGSRSTCVVLLNAGSWGPRTATEARKHSVAAPQVLRQKTQLTEPLPAQGRLFTHAAPGGPWHCHAVHPPAAHGPPPPPKSSRTGHTVLSHAALCCTDAPPAQQRLPQRSQRKSPAGACGAGRACACVCDASGRRRGPRRLSAAVAARPGSRWRARAGPWSTRRPRAPRR